MTYHLSKIYPDGYKEFKDSGNMSAAIKTDDVKGLVFECDSSPKVGYVIRVGSSYARTYVAQDWWQTSLVTEILSDETVDDSRTVIFNTLNSKYEWISR